jgi:hypothetical protein
MFNLNVFHDKLNVYLNTSFNNKKINSYFIFRNQYDYVCLTNLLVNDDESKINILEKFLVKYKYVFNHGKFINEDKSIILPSLIIFNISDDDIEFICNSMDIKYFYKSSIFSSGHFHKFINDGKNKFEKIS